MTLVSFRLSVFWLNIPDTSRRDKLFTNRGANDDGQDQLKGAGACDFGDFDSVLGFGVVFDEAI